ncbi:reverse transcriptase domain [Fusarium albosuccineum]|uniref:Reverse transcriptase domain n=1 Tax=Fusarium albosuccineum TaxID=1237068 RepID=A0A8H4LD21_9HYPO|nr:reverse transcriptase domain [Fusarium albosuccineum]
MASSMTNPPAALGPFDLGTHTPANLNRGARAALLQNSPAVNAPVGVPQEYNAKLMVFQAFCAKFEEAAQQFTTGPQRRFARQFADSFLDIWKRELSSDPDPYPGETRWAIQTADPETCDFLVEKQAEWAAELGAATTAETNKEWFAYLVSDFPTKLTDFRGNEMDSDSIVSDEIETQTGLKPVSPTKRYWSLFGSRAARLLDKTDRLGQCGTCWDHHFARNCHRQAVCQRRGKTGHGADDCAASEQCINCLGPHPASFRGCPARPKKVHGVFRRLTGEQREHVRAVGAETYRQRHLELRLETQQDNATALQRNDSTSYEQPSVRTSSPAASRTPSCIMVATAPQTGHEVEEEPKYPRPGSTRERRITRMNGRKTRRILQANVGKIPPAHDCALALADSERYDIVLLQEPWTAHTDSRSMTKTHPAYDKFTPDEIDSRLLADQIRPFQTRDSLWLTINGMTIVNFYRQNDEHDALETLLQWPVPGRCLVAGDFNARHRSWQTNPTTNRGQEIAAWSSENNLNLLNTLDIPTKPYGNTIDLAFTNMPLAEAIVEDHLATSSDHFTLSLTPPDVRPAPTQPDRRARGHKNPSREFDSRGSRCASLRTRESPDVGSEGSRTALTEEHAYCAVIAKRDLNRVVRRAKRQHWRNLIDSFFDSFSSSFSDSSAVFKAQARALPKRSAIDPVTALIHDIKEAFARKKVATLVTMNIQGAFDTVMRNRLVLRLREQGWPDHLAGWAESFMRDRSAPKRAPATQMTRPSSPSPRRKLRTAPAVRHGDIEKYPELALRWLGIWLDSRLSFQIHIEKWAAKAQVVTYHLRGLTNTIHGPLPSAVRSAVRACVEPVLLHGSEAWYPDRTRPRWIQPSKDLPSSNQHLIQRMMRAMNQAMRAVLPVWKTPPIAASSSRQRDTASRSIAQGKAT